MPWESYWRYLFSLPLDFYFDKKKMGCKIVKNFILFLCNRLSSIILKCCHYLRNIILTSNFSTWWTSDLSFWLYEKANFNLKLSRTSGCKNLKFRKLSVWNGLISSFVDGLLLLRWTEEWIKGLSVVQNRKRSKHCF